MTSVFWDSEGVLLIDSLIEEGTINAAYYSKFLKDRLKPAFHSKRRSQSSKNCLSPPRQRVSAHCRCDNGNIGEPGTKRFSPVRSVGKAPGGKRFSGDDEVKHFV
jgi:hypothetical protein